MRSLKRQSSRHTQHLLHQQIPSGTRCFLFTRHTSSPSHCRTRCNCHFSSGDAARTLTILSCWTVAALNSFLHLPNFFGGNQNVCRYRRVLSSSHRSAGQSVSKLGQFFPDISPRFFRPIPSAGHSCLVWLDNDTQCSLRSAFSLEASGTPWKMNLISLD